MCLSLVKLLGSQNVWGSFESDSGTSKEIDERLLGDAWKIGCRENPLCVVGNSII